MLLLRHLCSTVSVMMASSDGACRFRFEAVPNFFFDYAETAQQNADFRATTLPLLGLIDRSYETGSTTAEGDGRELWERFRGYVRELNTRSPGPTAYKVLYITRHGLGYHNVFEAQVGREAWNVSASARQSCVCRLMKPGSMVAPGWRRQHHLGGFAAER